MEKKTWIVDSFRVCFEDGIPIALLAENGSDTFYTLKRATKQDKDYLFQAEEVDEIK